DLLPHLGTLSGRLGLGGRGAGVSGPRGRGSAFGPPGGGPETNVVTEVVPSLGLGQDRFRTPQTPPGSPPPGTRRTPGSGHPTKAGPRRCPVAMLLGRPKFNPIWGLGPFFRVTWPHSQALNSLRDWTTVRWQPDSDNSSLFRPATLGQYRAG